MAIAKYNSYMGVGRIVGRQPTGTAKHRAFASARLIVSCLLPCLLAGCASIGPRSITAGRVAYAEAINQTQDEQILLAIVKGRYGESATLLAVNGVAANLKFRAELGIEAGFKGAGASGEDLIIGGMAYEENPTITYAPVQGEDYIRQLMSPVPLDFLLVIARSTKPDLSAFSLLVNRINDLRNPDFLQGPTSEASPEFKRLVELFSELSYTGALDLMQSNDDGGAFNVWFEPLSDKDAVRIAEVLDLLDLPAAEDDSKAIVVPAFFGIRGDSSARIGITTRSTFDLVKMMRAAVQVPEAHATAGITITYPPPGLAGQDIRIHSSTRKPDGQALSVKYRGYWFWIDDADLKTKAQFRLVRTLWSISISSTVDQMSAPVMTLPVGN
ncbi:hypothetical protein [Pontiella sulfatireligans]|uniref:Uncharacterized protein n=1 Tax=Pontiella sulfatireligans TaxID=2750658 RepID=A0A6C2UGI6_9BACT|nr:hypothetical protein [Pontiella sulfatireligans]VGO18627.1 hypothetical protein SCARR_00680 [Pontiella sulfatireligans]